jgi:hypothetical protein
VFTPDGALPALLPGALAPIAQFTVASPRMLRALGATVLAGRDFSDADRVDSLPVVIVNESLANWIWPGTSAIGKRVRLGRQDEQGRVWPWMTVVGVYGVIGYGVVQRRQEFGVRRALGAGPRDVLWLILREGLNLGAAGVAAGLVVSLAAAFGLRHLLFGISPLDPLTLGTSIVIVVAVTLAASIIPATAASRIEPRAALED